MKRLFVVLCLLPSLVFASPAFAEKSTVQQLEDAGIVVSMDAPQASAEALLRLPTVYALPGSFTYWLMHLVEEIQLIFTADPKDKAALLLSFSRNRLAESYEAIKSGKADSAIHALKTYQKDQHDLATSLNQLQENEVNIKPYLERLNEQLGVQKALQEYVDKEIRDVQQHDEISSLLNISDVQMLAWQRYNESALLGESDVKKVQTPQASQSATPSAVLK